MNRWKRMGVGLAALLLAALPASAGTVTGVVRNGTNGKAAGGVEVVLVKLESGMQDVAQTKSDAQGRFTLSNSGIGQQPMLLRASFMGVSYFQPVPPGKSDATEDIKVFEPTSDASAFQVLHHIIAVEPQGSNLMVAEEYDIQNKTNPPKAFYKADGCFTFQLPAGASLSQVQAAGPDGMPVTQGTVGKGKNRYAIIFPFRPGNNSVRLLYKMDYPSQQATLHLASLYPAMTAMIMSPPKVRVIAEGFNNEGTEHGWTVYSRSGLKANESMVFSVSGSGPPPGQGGQSNASGNSGNTVSPVAEALPPRLDSLKWILVVGFCSFFLLGAVYLWWRSRQPAVAGAVAVAGAAAVSAPASAPEPTPAATAPAGATTGAPGSGERGLRQSVDEIKETLFRLELRHQAGTLSEEAYQAQRKQMEQALRDLVKG